MNIKLIYRRRGVKMNKLFQIQNLVFYKEDFLDNIDEFEDIIDIIKELSPRLKYEKIEVVGQNDCCEKTNENYIIEIQGFLNEEDDFYTREEVEILSKQKPMGNLDLFVIRIYKCLNCNKWIIDILE
jgi:hypothetical protein